MGKDRKGGKEGNEREGRRRKVDYKRGRRKKKLLVEYIDNIRSL